MKLLNDWEYLIWNLLYLSKNLYEFENSALVITQKLGFDYFAYGLCCQTPFTRPRTAIYTNYPSEWIDIYKAKNYVLQDPTVSHCKNNTGALSWSSLMSEPSENMWADASAFGLNFGIVQPSFSRGGVTGLLTLARSIYPIEASEFQTLKKPVRFFAKIAGEKIQELKLDQEMIEDINLTAKEREIIRWTADGKTSEEIGIILSLKIDTINFHQKIIQKKFGATNRIQAISYAIAKGMI